MARHRLSPIWLSAVIGLMAFELTARYRVSDWADTWSYETARLSRLPATTASTADYQRIYVAIKDKDPIIEPATAPWEITKLPGPTTKPPTTGRWHNSQTLPRWLAASQGWFNRWDGQRFEQGFCGSNTVIYSAQSVELWAWNTSTGEFDKQASGWQHGCQRLHRANVLFTSASAPQCRGSPRLRDHLLPAHRGRARSEAASQGILKAS
jgi:hypothetical protein